jgi:hypothetical protein
MGTSDAVLAASSQLLEAFDSAAHVDLDLSDLQRVTPSWGAVLSNILASHAKASSSLSVHLPSPATAANLQLARAGMYFALARHPGLEWDLDSSSALRRWRHDWAMAEVESPLFEFGSEEVLTEVPTTFSDDGRIVAFLNPILAPRKEAPEFQKAVTYPWLRHMMKHQGDFDPAEENRLHRQISFFTWELLDNIEEHAKLRTGKNCSLATFVTRGRRNLLNMCVMDTGIGVLASLEKRYPGADEIDIVTHALTGTLPLRGPGRGHGLHHIIKLLGEFPGSEFFLASGPTRDGGSIVATWNAETQHVLAPVKVPGLRMQGTVVLITMPFGRTRSGRSSGVDGRSDDKQLSLEVADE